MYAILFHFVIGVACGVGATVVSALIIKNTKKFNVNVNTLKTIAFTVAETYRNGFISEAHLLGNCLSISYTYKKRKFMTYLPFNPTMDADDHTYFFVIGKGDEYTQLNIDSRVGLMVSPKEMGVDRVIINDPISDTYIAEYTGDKVFNMRTMEVVG